MPNSCWKNRAVFDTWLRELDYQWLDDPEDITGDPQSLSVDMLHRLAGPPSTIIDWSCRPVRQAGHKLCRHGTRPAMCRLDGTIVVRCDEYVQLIWALCDGAQTTEEILSTLIELYPEDAVRIAQDLQETLRTLSTRQAIYVEAPVADDPGPLDRAVVAESSPKRKPMVVTVNPVETTDGEIRLSATLDEGCRPVRSIWFRLDERCRSFVHPNADPFVLVILMRAMRQGRDIVVHNAPVSAGLLANLERYQQLWQRWWEGLSRIEIRAETSVCADPETGQGALLAFSGGVDSCFTTYEYSHQKFVRHQQPVVAGMMIYRFDIECSDRNDMVFERAARNSRRILESVKLPLLTVRTNAKSLLSENWLDDHGVMLAAALHLFNSPTSVRGFFWLPLQETRAPPALRAHGAGPNQPSA